MRVTNKIIYSSLITDAQNTLSRASKAQEQISLGSVVNRPSDDPTAFSNIMEIYGHQNRNDQYIRNITDGLSWLTQSETSFNDATQALQKVRELAVQGSNGHLTVDNTKAIAKQVDSMLDQLVTVGNSNLGDKYIFAGLNNAYPPFSRSGDNISYTGDNTALLREIAPGACFQVNVDPQTVFNEKVNNIVTDAASSLSSIGANNLQFGEYTIGTSVAAAASDSSVVVTQAYSQAKNTIINSVSVPAANSYNASIFMDVTGITYDADGKITGLTAVFNSHEYSSASNTDTSPAPVTQVFTATNGDPDTATVTVGNVALTIDLTKEIQKGDRAVFNVTAAAAAGDKQITVTDADGKSQKWSFNPAAVDNTSSTLNFHTIDEDNGDNYNGNISFSASTIGNLNKAVSLTYGNVFDTLIYLRKKLEVANFSKVDNMLKYIDQRTDAFLQERSKVGARQNHFEAVEKQYNNQEVVLADVLKDLQDGDTAKLTIEYEEAKLAYQGVLSAGAKIMQTSLLNYLS